MNGTDSLLAGEFGMGRLWIVSDRSKLDFPLDWLLSSRTDCELHTLRDFIPAGPYPLPDVAIVDLESVPHATDQLHQRLIHWGPSPPAVLAVFSERYPMNGSQLRHLFVGEVIVPSEKGEAKEHVGEILTGQIDLLERVATVQKQLHQQMRDSRVIANSRAMWEVLLKLPNLASSNSTVLITGETGTGKELIAQAIHHLGPRAGHPFITVDCASIPEALIENELYGHVRGAYTDARSGTRGLIQEADGGTLFFDEVESLPLMVQSKLLRFLQERQVKPLGQARYSFVDVRIIAATNGDLQESVRRRQFREDLYYRLNVVPLFLPPLRQRRSDIPELARYFVGRHSHTPPGAISLPHGLMEEWMVHDWPGNLRELENRVQEWLAVPAGLSSLSNGNHITPAAIPSLAEVRESSLAKSVRSYLNTLLASCNGNISAAARTALIDRKSLRALLKKYGLDPGEFRK